MCALSTAEAIRDRVRTLIGWVDPISLTSDRFRDWRYEGKGNFREAMEAASSGAFRRYYVRNVTKDEPGAVSNFDFDERRLELEILVAYQQAHRAGKDNALDRDDVMEQDWIEIDAVIGYTARGNFGNEHDCTPLGATKENEEGDGVDFLVIRAEFLYKRAMSANGGVGSGTPQGLGG